jgi:hypothetical protein
MLELIWRSLVAVRERMAQRFGDGEAGIETTEVAVIAGAVVALAIALTVILGHFVMGQVSNLSH